MVIECWQSEMRDDSSQITDGMRLLKSMLAAAQWPFTFEKRT